MNTIKPTRIQRFIRIGGIIGTLHFAPAVFLWVVALATSLWSWGADRFNWSILLQALPAVGLLVGFLRCVSP